MKWWFLIGLLVMFDIPIIFLINLILRRWMVAAAISLLIAAVTPLRDVLVDFTWTYGDLHWKFEQFLNDFPSVVEACATGRVTRLAIIWAAQSRRRALVSALTVSTAVSAIAYFEGERIAYALPYPWAEPAVAVAKMMRPVCDLPQPAAVAIPELPVFNEPVFDTNSPPRTQLDPRFSALPVVKSPWQNFIGPFRSIRSLTATGPVSVDIVIDEQGRVVDAAIENGPKEFYAEALAIARTWRFEPFSANGRISAVRANSEVRIDVPSRASLHSTYQPTNADMENATIRLEQRGGVWGGPSYDITIRGNGSVTFDGDWAVALTGRHCAKLPAIAVKRLMHAIQELDVFQLQSNYSGSVTDQGTTTIALTAGGHVNSIELYAPESASGIPDAALALPTYLDYAAQARRWTTGNRFTAASLLAEGWGFSGADERSFQILAGIIELGDESTLNQILAAGARLPPNLQSFVSSYSGRTLIEIAADRREVQLVSRLLSASSRWSSTTLSRTLTDVARLGDVQIVRALIARGAKADFHPSGSKEAPLISASMAGVPDVVDVLLQAGARTDVRGTFGRYPLHWAVTWLDGDDPVLPGADRSKVAELLIRAGADVNARDDNGDTPIMSDWVIGADAVPVLLAHGADVTARDRLHGHNALMVCQNPKVTQWLLEAGADPYVKDLDGSTALDYAKASSRTDVVNVIQAWMMKHPAKR